MTVLTGVCISAVIYAVVFLFTDGIAAAFNSSGDPDIARLAHNGLRLYFPAFLPLGFNTVTAMYYASVNKAAPSLAVSVIRGLVLIVPAVFILPYLLGMNGVWVSLFTAETLTALGVIAFTFIRQKIKLKECIKYE